MEMALGTSYKTVLWKRWCREVSTVENEGQHTLHACCQTMCIRRGNVKNIFCVNFSIFLAFLVVIK